MKRPRPTRAPRRAFTLTEVMISMVIFTTVIALTFGVVISLTRLNLFTEQKEVLNEDYRRMAQVLADVGRTSNEFIIYPGIDDRSAPADIGGSGNLLLFVTYAPADALGDPNLQTVSRIVGVYLDAESAPGVGAPMRCFDSASTASWGVSFPATYKASPLELIPDASTHTGTELARIAIGSNKGGATFYKLNANSFMINGMIFRNQNNSPFRVEGRAEARSAYNLTITPRS